MLHWISICGGLIMMGHQARTEALFDYFRLEDRVPENHLLRLVDNPTFSVPTPDCVASSSVIASATEDA